MKLKILIYGFFFMILAVSCNKTIVEPDPLFSNAPILKAGTIGNKYYISKTGNNSNSGNSTSPFLTITKGLSVAASGDTVFVKSGTYQEYVRFLNSGLAGSPIVLSNFGKDIVTIDAANTNVYCIYAGNQSFLSVKGIRCKDATSYIFNFENCHDIIVDECYATCTTKQASVQCIMIDNGYNGTTRYNNYLIRNCVTMNGDRGIAIWNNVSNAIVQGGEHSFNNVNVAVGGGYPLNVTTRPTYITIDGVNAHNSVTSNIGTENCQYVTIKNCHSYMGGATGIQVETDSPNATIEDNLCEDNSRTWEYETGIWIYNSPNSIVRRNWVKNNQTGLRFRNASNFQAYNNIIESNNHKPTSSPDTHQTSGVDFNQSTGTFYNNTLIGNAAAGSSLGSIFVYAAGTCNVNIKNNIIYNDGGSQDMVFEQATTSDYNLVYNANRAINITLSGAGRTWNSYKTTSGQEAHSLNISPLFVSSTDYKLQSISSAINAGANVGLTTDYLKNGLVGLPDIGAYESTGSNPPSIVYYNGQAIATATKNDCGTGYTGSTVTYTVAAQKYSSAISQIDADGKATADLNANKQTFANTNGTCTIIAPTAIFYNVQTSATATKNDCGTGYTGSVATYSVAAKKYSSTVSQIDADNMATTDLNVNKQAYANTNGTCTAISQTGPPFFNKQISATATKNDCGTGYTGSTVTYTIAAGKYTSTQTQLRADNKALDDLNLNKQAYANANGTCIPIAQTGPPFYNKQISVTVTKNDCGVGYTGSSVTYTIAAGKYSSTQTQLRADNKALDDLNLNKQTYANANGTCTAIALAGPPYYNAQISVTVTKNDCGSGYTGSSVTYTVAAGKYTSTQTQLRANNKALDDLNLNKQAYANANGTCISIK